MQRSDLPAILQDCDLEGNFNTLDIGSLAEILSWIRNNSILYSDHHAVDTELPFLAANTKQLPSKMTKIHKYLNLLPVDNKQTSLSHNHSFLGPEIHISFNRLDDTIFLVEIYFPEFT